MIPHTDQALRMLAQRLMVQLLPELGSTYALSDGALIGLLMNAIADELAEGIQRRLDDIDDMKAVLLEGVDLLSEEEQEVMEQGIASMRLADIDARHDQLTLILITLHARSEEKPELAPLNAAIWAYLRRHTDRHIIHAVP
jgi:hypothetical protein